MLRLSGQACESESTVPSRPAARTSFDVSGPYAATVRLAIGLALLPGLGTGLLLALAAWAHLPLTIAWPQLAQVHGQIQALGFVVLFIVAAGLQLFPHFLGTPLPHAGRAAWGGLVLALGLMARFFGQPLPPGPLRVGLLVLGAVGVPAGVLLAGIAFHGLRRGRGLLRPGCGRAWRRFVAVGGVVLGVALGVYAWSAMELALGAVVVPRGLDEALIHLELAGFATCLVLAVASRIFARFLLLQTRPALEGRLAVLAWLWGAGLLLVALGWLLDSSWSPWLRWVGSLVELGVFAVWAWLLGLYDSPIRQSGSPHVTNPTRRWVRLAFGFLLFGLGMNVSLFGREALLGVPPSSTELSAARHALAQGFLMPLMVAMAVRLLPVVSGDALRHRLRVEITLDLLLVGALTRVAAEALGSSTSLTEPLIVLGGSLSLAGFGLFAQGMWSSLRRLPRPSSPPGGGDARRAAAPTPESRLPAGPR